MKKRRSQNDRRFFDETFSTFIDLNLPRVSYEVQASGRF